VYPPKTAVKASTVDVIHPNNTKTFVKKKVFEFKNNKK
jgi:hypothetical protein